MPEPLTYWKCPNCGAKKSVPAYQLATVGTPFCHKCGSGETEMERDRDAEDRPSRFNPSEVRRYVDVGTQHITEEDNQILTVLARNDSRLPGNNERVPIIVHEYGICDAYPEGTGFWLYVPPADDNLIEHDLAEWAKAGLSMYLCNLVRAAQAEGIDYVRLDCDGGEHEGFQTFEW
jgi:hypothetical protein